MCSTETCQSSNVSLFLPGENYICLDGVDYKVAPSFFLWSSNKCRVYLVGCGIYSRAAFTGNLLLGAALNQGGVYSRVEID